MITLREQVIAIIDNDILKPSDAIVLLEGDGFYRYRKAVSLFKDNFAPVIVFSGGITDYEYGSFPFEDILPRLLAEGVPEKCIIHENQSTNTYEQAVETIKLAQKFRWRSVILVATHDHQYRAYLTFLKVILDSKFDLIIFNAPARNLGWYNQTKWGKRIDRLKQEFERINKYYEFGHLATYEDVLEYQEWKENKINE